MAERWLLVTVAVAILALTLLSCTEPARYDTTSGETFLTQAAVNLAAATDVARRTAEAKQATLDAQAQWSFELTQTAVWVQTTATAQAQATAAAETRIRATATAQARATATAVAAEQATQTAIPEQTRTAWELAESDLEHQSRMTRLQWEKWTTPLIYLSELGARGILIVLGIWTLFWGLPRLYHLLVLWASRGKSGTGTGLTILLPPDTDGAHWWERVRENWLGTPRLLAYNPARDKGPGQVINPREDGPLPGFDPMVTARAQAVELAQAASGGDAHRVVRGFRQTVQGRAAAQPPAIRVVSPERVHDWIEDVEGQLLMEASE